MNLGAFAICQGASESRKYKPTIQEYTNLSQIKKETLNLDASTFGALASSSAASAMCFEKKKWNMLRWSELVKITPCPGWFINLVM